MCVGLEHLIPSSTRSTPFTEEACQELMRVLRLLDGASRTALESFIAVQLARALVTYSSTVRTRIIAKILLRTSKIYQTLVCTSADIYLAAWRRKIFHPSNQRSHISSTDSDISELRDIIQDIFRRYLCYHTWSLVFFIFTTLFACWWSARDRGK